MTKQVRSGLLQRATSLLRNVTHREQDEREIAAELDAHLSLLIEEKVRSGMKCNAQHYSPPPEGSFLKISSA